MKRFAFKAIAISIGATMLFSSCTPKAASPSSAAPAASSNVSKSATPTAEDAKVEYPELNLTVEVWDRGNLPSPSTAESNPLANWIKEKVKAERNINVTYVPVLRSQEKEKLNVMMAGNSAPDVVFAYNMTIPSSYAKNGGLTDLTSYIDQFGPNLKEQYGEHMQEFGMFYDKLYAIPAKRVNSTMKHMTLIRKDLLDKNGLAMPSTKAEFYEVLKTIKANEPGVVPYVMSGSNNEKCYENFIMSYSNYADEREFYVYNSDNTRLLSPGTKEGLRELNKWYNEGLISTDFALDDNKKQAEADIAKGMGFAWTDDTIGPKEAILSLMGENPSVVIEAVNAFEDSRGEYFFNKNSTVGMYIMNPKANEKNAEAMVKYIDWMLEGDNMYTLKSGLDLGFSELSPSGVALLKTTPEQETALGMASSLYGDLGIIAQGIDYGKPELFKENDIAGWKTDKFDPTALFDSVYKAREAKGLYFPTVLPYVTDAEAKFGTNIRDSAETMAAKVIAAKPEAFDATYDQELAQMNAAGLDKILEERGIAYDSMKK